VALADVLAPGLRVVLAGTAPRRPFLPHVHHYAGRGNLFWLLLHESGLTPERLRPEDDATLPRFGIGLIDLLKTREPDEEGRLVDRYHPAAFVAKLRAARPGAVAFVSATAANAFARSTGSRGLPPAPWGPTPWQVAGRPAFVLPGPSGANNGMPLALRVALWRDLADFLETL
jgi:TDG/mug DNA glycosylase family protein